jgi:hypothetical protein
MYKERRAVSYQPSRVNVRAATMPKNTHVGLPYKYAISIVELWFDAVYIIL